MQSGWLKKYLAQQAEQAKDTENRAPEAAPEPEGVSRRDFIRGSLAAGAAAGLAGTSLFVQHQTAHAGGMPLQTTGAAGPGTGADPQATPFWPSRWGPDDVVGATNWITPTKILQASRLIRTGRVYEMGHLYESDMPFFGTRSFTLSIPSTGGPGMPTGGPFPGRNALVYHDEWVESEIGQVGTQFDGLGHIGMAMGAANDPSQMYYYNGWTQAQIYGTNGLRALGVENVKPIFTRGYLIDVAGYRGGMLPDSYEITVADVLGALAWAGIDPRGFTPGDAFLFNTGWSSLWKVDNARFNRNIPGIGLEVAQWLIDNNAVVAGADTFAVEVLPNPDPDLTFPVHSELIMKNGIHIHEQMNFTSLTDAGVYEFVYVMMPLRMRGATGSPGRPIAMT